MQMLNVRRHKTLLEKQCDKGGNDVSFRWNEEKIVNTLQTNVKEMKHKHT